MRAPLQLKKTFEIRSTETDLWDRLHVDQLFSMMQEAASIHARVLGTGADVLDEIGYVFLLSGMSLRLDSYPMWGDEIEITTWCREIVSLYFIRDFRIRTTAGREIGRATSTWFLTDKESHRPVRPSVIDQLIEHYVFPSDSALGFNAPRFKKGQLDFAEQDSFKKFADFSDVDRNRHVNNTRYIAWANDFYYHHRGIEEPRVLKGIDINYLAEVKYGEAVKILGMIADYSAQDEIEEASEAIAIEGRDVQQRALFRAVLYD